MVATRSGPAAPSVVAQRLCDLLQMFPAAAVGGVQWRTLASTYAQRFSCEVDLLDLGYSSALAAATALLWDVLRVVQSDDTDNPIVALEDAVALVPRPGYLASWPSLYKALCEIVTGHGTHGKCVREDGSEELSHEVLFSQLRPLLQKHWHSCFDEGRLCYMTDEGTCVTLKKMKHLLQAVLRWREQHVAWQTATNFKVSSVADVLRPRLELTPSKRHNDLLLRYVQPRAVVQIPPALWTEDEVKPAEAPECAEPDLTRSPSKCSGSSSHEGSGDNINSSNIAQQLASLKAENALLRDQNALLQHAGNAMLCAELFGTPSGQDFVVEETDIFDNPFEPPPQVWHRALMDMDGKSSLTSTGTPNSLNFGSGIMTPVSQTLGSHAESGRATPSQQQQQQQPQAAGQMCALIPVWFPMSDRLQIPHGVVQQTCAFFEREGNGSVPSFFGQG
mmetsp:Transcript_1938/g.3553  ORF Transcript_1938/g.3553 Transcript_1938/m.3553 type:complete len:448 (-) Transcript_1938:19-1362(-)